MDGFPFPTIPPIVGTPKYNTIAEVNLKLNSNSASVQSNLGCGTLGLLQLTVSPAVDNTLSVTPFVVPVNPGSIPSSQPTPLAPKSPNFAMLSTPPPHSSTSTTNSSFCCRRNVHTLSLTQVLQIRPHNYLYNPVPPIHNLRQYLLHGSTRKRRYLSHTIRHQSTN